MKTRKRGRKRARAQGAQFAFSGAHTKRPRRRPSKLASNISGLRKFFGPQIAIQIPELRSFAQVRKRTFLRAFAECGNVSAAARAAEVSRRSHQLWLQQDPEYREAFAEAEEVAADILEEVARQRAIAGTLEPVYHNGHLVGWKTRNSDQLLIVLLKAHRPEKYADRSQVDVRSKVQLDFPDLGHDGKALALAAKERLAAKLLEDKGSKQ